MKNENFFFWVQNLKWATAHFSRRLGAGQARGLRGQCRGALGWGAGRAQAGTAGVRGRCAWRAGRRAWARRQAAATRERSGRVGVRDSWAQAQAGGRALGARQAKRWPRGRQGVGSAADRALGARQASAGRAWRLRPGRLGWP